MPFRNADAHPIGVFDSGLGGLSVLSEIRHLLPSEKIIYIGDSANSPYGDQSAEFVRERSLEITNFLVEQGVKVIVIACNTATIESVAMLREYTSIPIIGLEPAVKTATELSQNGIIGILATQRTIDSEHLLELTQRYANNKKVLPQGCPGLVELIETGELSNIAIKKLLNLYIQPLLHEKIDTLVLGCTHYPFLQTTIRRIVGDKVKIVDTSKPVARQLQRILKEHKIENLYESAGDTIFYNSDYSQVTLSAMQRLWKLSLGTSNTTVVTKAIELLPLPR